MSSLAILAFLKYNIQYNVVYTKWRRLATSPAIPGRRSNARQYLRSNNQGHRGRHGNTHLKHGLAVQIKVVHVWAYA